MKIDIEIISKELIKPSSPTPQHLRHLHYSFLDQTQPTISVSLLHFYSPHQQSTISQKSNLLKTSLSDVLTIFYPVAGRVRNNECYIDCNDEGVLFVEAKASCSLSQVLGDRNPSNTNYFTPFPPYEAGDFAGFAQLTWFKDGGCAISFGMAHKLGDGASMFTFLNTWASIATSKSRITAPPSFGYATLFPPAKMESATLDYASMVAKEKVLIKYFSFDRASVAAIKDKYAAANYHRGRQLSRVQALTGFILGRFIASTETEKKKSCVVIQALNLRSKMEPPLPETSFGNFSTGATTEVDIDLAKDEYCFGVADRMRDSVRNMAEQFKKFQDKDEISNFFKEVMDKFSKQKEVVSFTVNSLHIYPAYESDFGWGKPLWVGLTSPMFKNSVIFFGTKDGEGMEAQICLKEEDMAKFEIDHQLLAHLSSPSYAKLYPPSRL